MDIVDKAIFLKFFNSSGYVFDFTNATFDPFTKESIGVALQEKYGVSKGASLERFAHESDDSLVIKLFSDLLNYYKNTIFNNLTKESIEDHEKFLKCKELMQKYQDKNISVETPAIKNVSREYISNISSRALRDIEKNSFDSAITKSRTLIEEVFCFAVEKQHEIPSDSGDIVKLYAQVKMLYNMHQHPEADKRINELLSGLDKIISSISQMRNKSSDAHGVGSNRITIKDYHARLFVNSAMTVADFVLSVVENKESTMKSGNS